MGRREDDLLPIILCALIIFSPKTRLGRTLRNFLFKVFPSVHEFFPLWDRNVCRNSNSLFNTLLIFKPDLVKSLSDSSLKRFLFSFNTDDQILYWCCFIVTGLFLYRAKHLVSLEKDQTQESTDGILPNCRTLKFISFVKGIQIPPLPWVESHHR